MNGQSLVKAFVPLPVGATAGIQAQRRGLLHALRLTGHFAAGPLRTFAGCLGMGVLPKSAELQFGCICTLARPRSRHTWVLAFKPGVPLNWHARESQPIKYYSRSTSEREVLTFS